MTHDDFIRLVKRLEEQAARAPGVYRLRVIALGALAYLYVGTVLVVALGLLALLLFVARRHLGAVAKIGFALIAFVVAVLRSLWVRFDRPQGIPLEHDRHPELFRTVDRIRAALRAPRPHEVLLVDELNAAIVQLPRLGVLGWPRNTLILGLPLLHALSREQATAVIAHEFGHLAGAHGHFGAWIYRSRRSWSQLLERMEAEKHWASFVFEPFFRWYAPYFNAYSFVLARAQEYEADRCSAEVAGVRAAADALARVNLAAHCLEERWTRIWKRADDVERPDVAPYSDLRASDFTPGEADARQCLDAALRAETDYHDTHPCLRERLAALGQGHPRLPEPVARSAAEELLGDGLVPLAAQLDGAWEQAVRENWGARHAYVNKRRAQLAELEARAREAPLAGDDRFHYAELVEEIGGDPDAALALHRAILAHEPRHASANLEVGRLLLARKEAAGLDHLEAAIDVHHSAILPASRVALPYLQAAGREADAERWLTRAQAHQRALETAQRERDVIPFRGRYEPHGLAPEQIEALRAQLARCADVRRAWLVRRRLSEFDEEQPQWVLCAERRAGFWEGRRHKRAADLALQQRLTQIQVEGDVRIVVINHEKKARRIYRDLPDSEIRLSVES